MHTSPKYTWKIYRNIDYFGSHTIKFCSCGHFFKVNNNQPMDLKQMYHMLR